MPKPKTSKPMRLREGATLQPTGLRVDRSAATVHGVKLLGLESENGYSYLHEAVARAVAGRMYEGVKVNFNHQLPAEDETAQPRLFQDRFGRVVNSRMQPDGPYGDLKYNPAHPFAETFLWFAENDPAAIGLSQSAEGLLGRGPDGRPVVEEITKVFSVDLVADPATTRGLYECSGGRMEPEKNKPVPMLEDDDLDDEDSNPPPEEPAPPAPSPAPETGGMNDKIADIVRDIVLDASMDDGAKLAKIKALLKIQSGDKPAEKTEESRKPGLAEAVAKLRASTDPNAQLVLAELDFHQAKAAVTAKRARARKLCQDARLPAEAVSEIFLETLLACPDERAMQRLIEDRRHAVGAAESGKPLSAAPSGAEVTLDQFVAGITGEDD